jgi:ABC-type Na+ transport system ATPase subunit NatA
VQEKLAFYPSCGQALQVADKGFYDLEAARERLYFFGKKYGLSSPLTLRQSRLVDSLILLQMKKKCN